MSNLTKNMFALADSFSSVLILVSFACYASDFFQWGFVMLCGTVFLQFVIILLHRDQLGFTYKQNDSEKEF
jgi:hypothetical protein